MSSFVAVPLFFFAPALIPNCCAMASFWPVMSATAAATPVLAADEAWIQHGFGSARTEVRAWQEAQTRRERPTCSTSTRFATGALCGFIGCDDGIAS